MRKIANLRLDIFLSVILVVCIWATYYFVTTDRRSDIDKIQNTYYKFEGAISIVQLQTVYLINSMNENKDNDFLYESAQNLKASTLDAKGLLPKIIPKFDNKTTRSLVLDASNQCYYAIDYAGKFGDAISKIINQNNLNPKSTELIKYTQAQYVYYRDKCMGTFNKAYETLGYNNMIIKKQIQSQ